MSSGRTSASTSPYNQIIMHRTLDRGGSWMTSASEPWITLDYTNHRGERKERLVRPERVWHGRTDWHPEYDQWLLEAFDKDRQDIRNFTLRNIHNWRPSTDPIRPSGVGTGVYRHFKGGLYLVTAVARHSETEDFLVVYRALYGKFDLWVRPLKHFQEVVADPAGNPVPRFDFTGPI
ncbi:DUF1653 domain-containing protein [Parafrankia discariae]|uniref:DUF1653 domain-containing protein n=1 Tax=Parafrankia discariae TaxID=365528 RepID=UPI0003797AF8|nr:DUF1653 domain-containing protein [Parafrankia discariae]